MTKHSAVPTSKNGMIVSSNKSSMSTRLSSFESGLMLFWRYLNRGVSSDVLIGFIYSVYIIVIVSFISLMLILVHHILPGQFPYKSTSGRVAYYMHVVPGSLYFIMSIMQFSPYVRHNFVKLHRILGRIYFILQVLALIGVVVLWLGAKLESGIGGYIYTPFFFGYWVATGYPAYRYAVVRDIPQHQIWIIRNSVVSYSIIFSRPAFLILQNLDLKTQDGHKMYSPQESLAISILICFVAFGYLGEWFIYARFKKGIFARNGQDLSETIALEKPIVTLPVETEMPSSSLIRKTLPTNEFTSIKLIAKHSYKTSNTILLRFQLLHNSSSESVSYFPIPVSHHVALRINNELIRLYTPISTDTDHLNGHIDFLIAQSNAPTAHSFSNQVNNLPLNSIIEILPKAVGNFRYVSNLQPEILLIALGSGIAPIFSLIRKMVIDSDCNVKIKLVYSAKSTAETASVIVDPAETQLNHNESETSDELPLVKEILEYQKISLARENGAKIVTCDIRSTNWESLNKYKEVYNYNNVNFSTDRVTSASVKQYLPNLDAARKIIRSDKESWDIEIGSKCCVFICGPTKAELDLSTGLRKLGYGRELVWRFGLNGR